MATASAGSGCRQQVTALGAGLGDSTTLFQGDCVQCSSSIRPACAATDTCKQTPTRRTSSLSAELLTYNPDLKVLGYARSDFAWQNDGSIQGGCEALVALVAWGPE